MALQCHPDHQLLDSQSQEWRPWPSQFGGLDSKVATQPWPGHCGGVVDVIVVLAEPVAFILGLVNRLTVQCENFSGLLVLTPG